MGSAGPNAIVSVTGVFVTRTTRDDAYDGMNVAWAGVDLPLGSYFVYDLGLPSNYYSPVTRYHLPCCCFILNMKIIKVY